MDRTARPRELATATLISLGLLLTGCTDSPDGDVAHTDPSPSSDRADADAAAPLHLVGSSLRLAPGTYQFSFQAGADTPDALVEVARGFEDGDDWYVVSGDDDTFLGLWTVRQVQHDA